MAQQYMTQPKRPPPLNVPQGKTVVKVSCIDRQDNGEVLPLTHSTNAKGSTSRFELPIGVFLQPDYTGKTQLLGPSFSFLIEHPERKPILFDLAIRKDFQVFPSAPKWKENGWKIEVEKDVATILKENGVDVEGGAIESIILSHHHWDHVGDASTFPSSTEVVVGPGFKEAYLPGFPTNKESNLMEADFEGRTLRDISFEKDGNGLKIGRFNAYDYFGDGSFYLLDTPGHSVGHMCGFARTSANPDTFIFMGGDASHHGGEYKPNDYSPIPKEFGPIPPKRRGQGICPGHLLEAIHPHNTATKPFYYVTALLSHNKEVADQTIEGLGEFDAHENVLLLLAHDDAVIDPPEFDFYPKPLSDWYQKGVAKRVKWLFLGDLESAVEAKEKGEKPYTWGKYP